MASITKYKNGYRVHVARKGQRVTKTFSSKQEARDWAAATESEILNQGPPASKMSFGDLMARYGRDVSPKKRGARWEIIRLEKISRDPIATITLADLRAADFSKWRDQQLLNLAPASVAREMQLLNAVLNVACDEWELISVNPMRKVKKPPKPPARDRLPTTDELERLAHAAGADLSNRTARAFHAFRFAMATAMRAGEIVNLRWDDINIETKVAHLRHTKNGYERKVPLSPHAIDILAALPRLDPVFGLNSSQLASLWSKVRNRAQIDDLTFHDSRHAAITNLAQKLDVLALARMVGHRDLRQLQTYYNEPAEDIAKRLS